jgi:hypothetical protein
MQEQIIAEVKAREPMYEAEATGQLLGYRLKHHERIMQARYRARERVQQELAKRFSDEELRFAAAIASWMT